ncbi:PH, RCC1 and FYVE domains-containing protein 1 isoform X1 [Capsicum chacoense]
MGEEYLTIDPSDRAVEQAIVALKKGAHLLKYGRRGKPKFYPLRLSADEKFLIWYSGEKENQLRLSSITNVIRGQNTVILQPEMESQCISLIYGSSDRTLDLICKDKMQADTWFVGLRAVISRTHHHRIVDPLKSKRGTHSCISSPAGYMRRKQNLGLSAKTIRPSQVRSVAGSPTQSFSESCFTDGLSCSSESFFSESSLWSVHNVTDNVTSCSSYFERDNLSQNRASCTGTEIQTDMLAPLSSSSSESRPFGKNVLRDVFIWGEGAEGGCLGDGEVKLDALSPKVLESTMMLDVQAISIGRSHASLVTKQGEVFCWGEGKNGRLGHKHDMDTARPKLVDSLYGVHVKSVTCGEYQTCAVTSSGELYTWGDNSFGAELVGEEKKRSHWLPKRICGALDGVKISYVACAEWHTAVVSTSGQLFTYGDGTFGVLGHGNLQSVAQPREVESLRGLWVKCVACGPWHTAAVVEIIIDHLKFNNPGGKLFTWGDGDKGRLGHPGEETKLLPTCVAKLVDHDFIQVSCASTLTIALSSTGKVYTMGSAVHGQLGNPDAKDKSLVLVQGKLREEFITEISSGSYHVAVLTSRGSVYTWGKGADGQLGLGDTKERNLPTLVESLRDRQVEHIACGSSTTAAICLHKSTSSTDQSVCRGCGMSFGITRKKQNCYNCGLLFCRTCCSKKTTNASLAPDKTKAFRVCDPCFLLLQRIAQSSRTSTLENHSPRPLPIAQKAVTREKVEREEANTTSSRMVSTKNYATENNQCFDRRGVNSLGKSRQFSDPVTSLLDSFPRWGQVPCPEFFRRDYGQMRTQNHHPRNSLASASPTYLQQIPVEPKVVPPTGLTMEEDLPKSDKILFKEVCKLRTQVESLKRLCETRKEKIQESQQKVEEAWSVAKEEVSKSKAAKEVIKALTSRLQAMSGNFFAGTETNVQAISNVLQITSTYSDSHNNINGHRIVVPTCVPLANTQLEDKNIDSLCGSPIVFSSTLRSFYNKENNVDSKSAEESRKEADHGQAELRTSKAEWVEQYQLGVFITLTVLPSGKKGLKRVRFSRKKFTEKEAEKWWEENQLSVYKKYDVEGYENVNQGFLKK